MEYERIYEDFRDLIRCCLQDAVEAGSISMEQVDAYDKLIDMDKDLQEIVMNERVGDYYEKEYSRGYGGHSYRGNDYGRHGGSYRGGGSYNRGYSRTGDREHMMEKMQRMMGEATSEQEREAIRKVLDTM